MKKDKRGVSNHVEMILASVLFITFFFFVMIFLQPYKNDSLSLSVVDSTYYVIDDMIKSDVREMFVNIKDSEMECFKLSVSISGSFNSIVKNGDGEIIESFVEEDGISIYGGEDFYYLYFSEDFSKGSSSGECELLEVGQYDVGGSYDREIVYLPLLLELENNYNNNYDILKKDLGIPKKFDFAINSNIVNMQRVVPDGVEIVAKNYVENVIDENGNISNEIIVVRIW